MHTCRNILMCMYACIYVCMYVYEQNVYMYACMYVLVVVAAQKLSKYYYSSYCGMRWISSVSNAGTSGAICFMNEQNDSMFNDALSER